MASSTTAPDGKNDKKLDPAPNTISDAMLAKRLQNTFDKEEYAKRMALKRTKSTRKLALASSSSSSAAPKKSIAADLVDGAVLDEDDIPLAQRKFLSVGSGEDEKAHKRSHKRSRANANLEAEAYAAARLRYDLSPAEVDRTIGVAISEAKEMTLAACLSSELSAATLTPTQLDFRLGDGFEFDEAKPENIQKFIAGLAAHPKIVSLRIEAATFLQLMAVINGLPSQIKTLRIHDNSQILNKTDIKNLQGAMLKHADKIFYISPIGSDIKLLEKLQQQAGLKKTVKSMADWNSSLLPLTKEAAQPSLHSSSSSSAAPAVSASVVPPLAPAAALASIAVAASTAPATTSAAATKAATTKAAPKAAPKAATSTATAAPAPKATTSTATAASANDAKAKQKFKSKKSDVSARELSGLLKDSALMLAQAPKPQRAQLPPTTPVAGSGSLPPAVDVRQKTPQKQKRSIREMLIEAKLRSPVAPPPKKQKLTGEMSSAAAAVAIGNTTTHVITTALGSSSSSSAATNFSSAATLSSSSSSSSLSVVPSLPLTITMQASAKAAQEKNNAIEAKGLIQNLYNQPGMQQLMKKDKVVAEGMAKLIQDMNPKTAVTLAYHLWKLGVKPYEIELSGEVVANHVMKAFRKFNQLGNDVIVFINEQKTSSIQTRLAFLEAVALIQPNMSISAKIMELRDTSNVLIRH